MKIAELEAVKDSDASEDEDSDSVSKSEDIPKPEHKEETNAIELKEKLLLILKQDETPSKAMKRLKP